MLLGKDMRPLETPFSKSPSFVPSFPYRHLVSESWGTSASAIGSPNLPCPLREVVEKDIGIRKDSLGERFGPGQAAEKQKALPAVAGRAALDRGDPIELP
jgi:hypothetical protein